MYSTLPAEHTSPPGDTDGGETRPKGCIWLGLKGFMEEIVLLFQEIHVVRPADADACGCQVLRDVLHPVLPLHELEVAAE